jgi:hypothetical protein
MRGAKFAVASRCHTLLLHNVMEARSFRAEGNEWSLLMLAGFS